MIKVKVTDNNADPQPFEGTASVQVNVDNEAPTGAITMWGINALEPRYQSSKVHNYLGGSYGDSGGAGVRYVNLYFWNNQAPTPDDPVNYNYSGVSSPDDIVVSDSHVQSGTHRVQIPENLGSVSIGEGSGILPENINNKFPNFWIRALRTETDRWKVGDVYAWNENTLADVDGNVGKYYGIETKYGGELGDGIKLVALEVIDKAGNKTRKFYEQTFAQYPPSIGSATSLDWVPTSNSPQTKEIGVDPVIYMSTKFNTKIYATDSGPRAGINRVRLYIRKGSTYERAFGTDYPKDNAIAGKALDAEISESEGYYKIKDDQSLEGLSGTYKLIIEVRDNDGALDVKEQDIFVDNTPPTLTIASPLADQKVIGLVGISGVATDNDQIDDNLIDVQIYNGGTQVTNWAATSVISGTYSKTWDVSETSNFTNVQAVVEDRAKNRTTLIQTVSIDNEPPKISKLVLTGAKATSYNTFLNYYTNSASGFLPDSLAQVNFINTNLTIAAGNLIVIDDSATDVTEHITTAEWRVTGHKQSTTYAGEVEHKSLANLNPSASSSAPYSVGGSSAYSAALDDGEYGIKIKILQGGTKTLEIDSKSTGTSSYFIVDKQKPHIWMEKMKNIDFKGYGSSNPQGHIDVGLNSNGSTTGYDDVSGIVYVDIGVFDNHLIDKVDATLPGGMVVTIASRNVDGTWGNKNSGLAETNRNYWKCDFKPADEVDIAGGGEIIRKNKNWMKLRLEFNTARITNVAALNQSLRVSATDMAGNVSDTASFASQYESGDGVNPPNFDRDSMLNNALEVIPVNATYQKATEKLLDIVPYITKIETNNRIGGGLKNNNIRSASGKYSIIQGSNASFITVKGFNLKPFSNSVRIVPESNAYKNGVNGTTLQGTVIAYTGVDTSYTSFSLTNNASKSGYLAVVSGTTAMPVGSINNVNSNAVVTNQEPDPYLTKNLILNDDRYLRFFATKQTVTKNGYYPHMILDSDNNPVFGYLDMSGGPGGASGGGSYYPSHAMPQRTKYNLGTGNKVGNTSYLIKASIWDQMGMAKDDGGRYYHATLYNRDQCGFVLIYDEFSMLHTPSAGYGWGAGVGYSDAPGPAANATGNNAIALETTDYGGLLLERYKYPKIITKGDSTSSNGCAVVYMMYYDDNTANKELLFRNLQIGSNHSPRTTALYNGSGYSQRTNFTENTGNSKTWSTGRITAATSASAYFDMAVTSTNIVVLVYYDEIEARLKMRYSNSAINGTNTSVTWSDSPVVFPDYVGSYVSMTIDGSNRIHIAAFDATDADLTYIFVPNYASADKAIVTVDSYGSVGQWTQIKVQDNIPHIGYYNSTETGTRESIKYAYANFAATSVASIKAGVDANDNTTGYWEYMTVPALSPAQGGIPKFQKVNLDFHSDKRPVLGYLGAHLEFTTTIPE